MSVFKGGWRIGCSAFAMFLCPLVAVQSQVVSAQQQDELMKAVMNGFTRLGSQRVTLTPTIVLVDHSSKSATIEVSNPTSDTLVSEIKLSLEPPPGLFGSSVKKLPSGSKAPAKKPVGSGLLADEELDSMAKKPARTGVNDTIPSAQSLIPWLKAPPSTLTLAPGEKKTITIEFSVPADTKPGEYSAWLLTFSKATLKIDVPDNKYKLKTEGEGAPTMRISNGAKITYRIPGN